MILLDSTRAPCVRRDSGTSNGLDSGTKIRADSSTREFECVLGLLGSCPTHRKMQNINEHMEKDLLLSRLL